MLDLTPTALSLLAGALYFVGDRSGRPPTGVARLRRPAFFAGLATIVLALSTPVDSLADQLFWVHMGQHLLLLNVAAPLIAFGSPWMPMWRALPLGLRRWLAPFVVHARLLAPLRTLARAVGSPGGAWLAFTLSVVVWHLPEPYDATLRDNTVHILEHLSFLAFGVAFWTHVMAPSRSRRSLQTQTRIAYVAAAMVANIGLSMYLAFVQHPLYTPYAQLLHRPGGISALADQQIGAGLMWAAGDMPFAIAVAVLIQRWLAETEARTSSLAGLFTGLHAGEREAS